jgi:hypothetical protein
MWLSGAVVGLIGLGLVLGLRYALLGQPPRNRRLMVSMIAVAAVHRGGGVVGLFIGPQDIGLHSRRRSVWRCPSRCCCIHAAGPPSRERRCLLDPFGQLACWRPHNYSHQRGKNCPVGFSRRGFWLRI